MVPACPACLLPAYAYPPSPLCPALPAWRQVIIWVELTPAQRAYYKAIFENEIGTVGGLSNLGVGVLWGGYACRGAGRGGWACAWGVGSKHSVRRLCAAVPQKLQLAAWLTAATAHKHDAQPFQSAQSVKAPPPKHTPHTTRIPAWPPTCSCWLAQPPRTCPTCATWPWSCAKCAATR